MSAHTSAHTHPYRQPHTRAHAHAYTHARMHTHTYSYAHGHTHTHAHTCIHTYTRAQVFKVTLQPGTRPSGEAVPAGITPVPEEGEALPAAAGKPRLAAVKK